MDCHRPLVAEIVRLIVLRDRTGVETSIVKVKPHIGINSTCMADKLARAAEGFLATGRGGQQKQEDASHDYSGTDSIRTTNIHTI